MTQQFIALSLCCWCIVPFAASDKFPRPHVFPHTSRFRFRRRGPLSRHSQPIVHVGSPRKAALFDPSGFHFGSDPNDIDADFDPNFIPEALREGRSPDISSSSSSQNNSKSVTPTNDKVDNDSPMIESQRQKLPHTPVIYRYYGKSRSRTRASGSIPFILLGSNVDHWRTTGEHLAARGFSVIACERDPLDPEDEATTNNNSQKNEAMDDGEWWKGPDGEGASMISHVLQASRWTKAILVACDSEAVLAIQAAYGLAPSKIAGLVLVGDLKEVDSLLKENQPSLCQQEGSFAVDALLTQILPCPFAIAWDGETTTPGDKTPTPSQYDGTIPAECLQGNRCFILGGGVAPHRRQPETFSWTLTRFVEDKVAPSIPMAEKRKLSVFGLGNSKDRKAAGASRGPRLPKGLSKVISRDYFSSGSLVVYGRILASALLYASMLKVGIYQYAKFLDGMVNMKTRYDILQSLRRKTVGVISGFFLNYGYIPLIFRKEDPEPDPTDFFTESANTAGGEAKANNDNADEAAGQNGVIEDPSGSEEEAADNDEPATSDENEPSENASDDREPEQEERIRFRPLFFLDRVVA
jgi:hypothetical protein